jgi:DmsE family decaheme c-type cytochrome
MILRCILIENCESIVRMLKAAAGIGTRFMLLMGVIALCATAMAAQSGEAAPGGQQLSTGPADAATCAACHKDVVMKFTGNPHSKPSVTLDDKSVTCESCHGPAKAHVAGDISAIFNPATATAKDVNEKCQTCHSGKHMGIERSTHGKGSVSCIGCHSVHSAAAPMHLLKLAQPELCYQCHKEIKPQFSMSSRHKVAEGVVQCTDCHDMHGTNREKERHASAWQINACAKCHTAEAGPFVDEHAAVKVEGCTGCHLPHGGANPKLLTQANVNTICLQCHAPFLSPIAGQPASASHGHSTQGQSCISCHSAIHGSNTSNLFLNPAQENGR